MAEKGQETRWRPEKYKISYLSCGCCWNNYFPFEQIKLLVEHKLYTPINPFTVDSYFSLINIIHYINENNFVNSVIEFRQGIYQILGTLICRGYSKNYFSENVLLELFTIIELSIFNKQESIEFNKFLNKEIHWTLLPRNIKNKVIFYLYGSNL